MLDIRFVREKPERVVDSLRKRGENTEILDKFLKIEKERRDLLRVVEDQRQIRNKLSQEIGGLKKEGKE